MATVPNATTVARYMDGLPAERRAALQQVLDVVRRHMPAGYEETIEFGMPTWVVPLSVYPKTYNKRPLPYVALAAQKNHFALYLTGAYQSPDEDAWLRDAFARAGKKLDMGKSCLRFKRVEELPLDVVGAFVERVTPPRFIEMYELARAR